MRTRHLVILIGVLVSLLAVAGVSSGQDAQNDTCPALIDRVFAEIGSNCDGVDRNNACYGFNRVATSFFEPQSEDFFSQPSDRSQLSILQTIQTTPLNSTSDEWGVAVMNVQANVPGGLPGQAVVFILYGDVEVENAVTPDEALIPGDPVDVTVLVNANARSGPGTNYNVIMGVPSGTVVSADGLNSDQTWVRILYDETAAWMSRDLVQPEVSGALNDLPVMTNNTRTPMQAFQLRTGFGSEECLEAPSTLMVQGPDNVRVDLTVNGADIQIGSTIALRITPDNFLQVITLSGVANIAGIQLPAGFTMQVPLTEDGQNIDGLWQGFRPLTAGELESLQWLELTPESLLHYPLILPTLGEIARTNAAISRPAAPPTLAPGAETTQEAPVETAGDCAGFVATSPLDSASTGEYTFYWDPAPGADGYRWILLDANAAVLSIFDTQQTNFTYNLSPEFTETLQWEVHALSGSEVRCVTPRVVIQLIGGGQDSTQNDVPLYEINDPEQCAGAGGYWYEGDEYCGEEPPVYN